MKITVVLTVATVVLVAVASSDALKCLSCAGISQPHDCKSMAECGQHEQCYTDLHVTPDGYTIFSLGCRDQMQCTVHKRHLSGASLATHNDTVEAWSDVTDNVLADVGSHLSSHHKRGLIICSQCCATSDLCNVIQCGSKGYQTPRGPICYACPQQMVSSNCLKIQVCGQDESCFIEDVDIAGHTVFHTGCYGLHKCSDEHIMATVNAIVGRRSPKELTNLEPNYEEDEEYMANFQTTRSCCTLDFCNNYHYMTWGQWQTWTACSASCGWNGIRSRYRFCPNQNPNDHNQIRCPGADMENDHTCANKDCKNSTFCLRCDDSIFPSTCQHVEQCGEHSACYTDQYQSGGNILYATGCRDKQQCGVGGKRFIEGAGENIICSQCCQNKGLCNYELCGHQPLVKRVCYSCEEQRTPLGHSCSKIQVCAPNEECGLMKVTKNGIELYTTSCLAKENCKSTSSADPMYPKCCDSNLCYFTNNNETAHQTQLPTQSPHITTKSTPNYPGTNAQTTMPSNTGSVTQQTHQTAGTSILIPTHAVTVTTDPPIPLGWGPWGQHICLETSINIPGTQSRWRTCYNPSDKRGIGCYDGDVQEEGNIRLTCYGGTGIPCQQAENVRILGSSQMKLGQPATLSCLADGDPTPHVTWTTPWGSSEYRRNLVIDVVTTANEGVYTCQASNQCSLGKDSAVISTTTTIHVV